MKLKSNLLTTQNAKTNKGENLGYLTGILYLAPSDIVKGINVCKFASKGCKAACLYTAGRGKFNSVKQARINKTVLFRDNREYFMRSLVKSIKTVIRKAYRENLIPCIRLNGTSDIRWENELIDGMTIFEIFPLVQFYDYTKDWKRFELNKIPKNYHITFSLAENNMDKALLMLSKGINVATVFRDKIPNTFKGYKTINGDNHDLRFLDKSKGKGIVIGLKAKGDAKKDVSGFVQDIEEIKLVA